MYSGRWVGRAKRRNTTPPWAATLPPYTENESFPRAPCHPSLHRPQSPAPGVALGSSHQPTRRGKRRPNARTTGTLSCSSVDTLVKHACTPGPGSHSTVQARYASEQATYARTAAITRSQPRLFQGTRIGRNFSASRLNTYLPFPGLVPFGRRISFCPSPSSSAARSDDLDASQTTSNSLPIIPPLSIAC